MALNFAIDCERLVGGLKLAHVEDHIVLDLKSLNDEFCLPLTQVALIAGLTTSLRVQDCLFKYYNLLTLTDTF